MTEEDRSLIRELIAAIAGLTGAIQQMPRTITHYPADYRAPGGYGGGAGGAGGRGSDPRGGEGGQARGYSGL